MRMHSCPVVVIIQHIGLSVSPNLHVERLRHCRFPDTGNVGFAGSTTQMTNYVLRFPISTSASPASPSSSHSPPFSLFPSQSPMIVAALAAKNQPSNHLSVKPGSSGAPNASPILLFISGGKLLRRSNVELMTYVAAICEMMRAKFVFV